MRTNEAVATPCACTARCLFSLNAPVPATTQYCKQKRVDGQEPCGSAPLEFAYTPARAQGKIGVERDGDGDECDPWQRERERERERVRGGCKRRLKRCVCVPALHGECVCTEGARVVQAGPTYHTMVRGGVMLEAPKRT